MEVEYIEENRKTWGDYLAIVKRRKKIIILMAAGIFALFATILFFWPPVYQSKAIILIEEQDVPPDLVPSTITSYAVQRIEEIKQRIMTNANIIDIVERFELLDEQQRRQLTRSEIAADFRSNVAITPISAEVIDPRSGRPTQATIAFSVSFKGDKINTVHKITNELVTLLLNENLKERAQQSESTAQFLSSEADALDRLLKEYEQRISDFKEQHKGSLPELSAYNMNVVDRGHQELLSIQTRILDLENRKINLAAQLTQLDKSAPTILPNGEAILGPADRLKALRSEYSYKRAVYTEDHPELLRLKREIEALSNHSVSDNSAMVSRAIIAEKLFDVRKNLAATKDQYSSDHPKVVAMQRQVHELEKQYSEAPQIMEEPPADNPSYILVATQIDGINSEIASLAHKTQQLQERISEHEQLLLKSPGVEKEYQAMLRDYDNARMKYREIKAKLMTADLAKNLEQERKGERFTLIQPPEIPEKPVSPNIKMLSVFGFVLCLGMGFGGGLLADNMDSHVYGQKRIVQITQLEPLVTIPYMYTDADLRQSKMRMKQMALGLVATGITVLLLFHFMIKPLDVVWFILLRKFGLN